MAASHRGTPDHERKAYDLLIQAEAGISALTGSADSGPSRVGISICDIGTGQAAYAAILAALIARGRTGEGAHLQVSLFDTMAEYMNVPYLARRHGGAEPRRIGLAHPSIAPYGVFSASDGEIVIAIQNEREWAMFCEGVLGEPALAGDQRFASNVARVENRAVLDAHIGKTISQMPLEALCALLDRHRIAYGRISTLGDLMRHRSLATVRVETPGGIAELVASPVIVDGERLAAARVPALGEHDEALRREFMPADGPAAISGSA